MRVVSKSSRVVNISWTAGFDGNSAITNYKTEISAHDQTSFRDVFCQGSLSRSSCVISSSFTRASLNGLLPWTTYFVRVFARNVVGSSVSSSLLNVTTNEEGKKDSNLICENPSDPSSSYEHYLSSSENWALRFIWNQHNAHLPIGLLAQLVECWTSLYDRGHEFKSRTGLNFFQALFSLLLK